MASILSGSRSKTQARKYNDRPAQPRRPKYWENIERATVENPIDLFLLVNRIVEDPDLWFVQGNPGAPNEQGFYRRCLKAKTKTKKDQALDPAGLVVPETAELLIFDIDEGAWPEGCGPETPPLTTAHGIVDRLFSFLNRPKATAVVAYSGNHIFKGCRAKVLVIPDRPISWAAVSGLYARAGSDPTMANPAQPIYLAPPVLPPSTPDPIPEGRVFLVRGAVDTMDCAFQEGDSSPRTWDALREAQKTLENLPVGAARHPVVNKAAFKAAGVAAGEQVSVDLVVKFLTDLCRALPAFGDRDFNDEIQRGAEDGYQQPIIPLDATVTLTKDGDVKATLSNAAVLLGRSIRFEENDFGDHEIVRPPPWDATGDGYPMKVEEYQLRCATMWLQSSSKAAFRKADVSDAIGILAGGNRVDRLTAYLDKCAGLPEGQLNLDNAASEAWAAKDTPSHRLAIRRFLLQCVSRAYDPGCHGELVLVLHAKPGSGKGRSAWQLFTRPGTRYFTSSHIPISNQAQYAPILRGLWGAELGEQRSVSAWDQDRFKAFVSQRKIVMRLPYERRATEIPLRVNYVWTTELEAPINDDNWRRFLVLEVGKWQEWPGEEIDKLWGDAVRAYRRGERAYLDDMDERTLRPARELAYSVDSLEGSVEEILRYPELRGDTRAIDTVIRILSMRAHFGVKVSDGAIRHRVGRIMKRLGWENKAAWADGKSYRKYEHPDGWKFNEEENAEDFTKMY